MVILLTMIVGVVIGCGSSDAEVAGPSTTPPSVPSDPTPTSDPTCEFAQERVAGLQGETGFDSFVLYIGRAGDSSVWETSEGYTLVVGDEIVEHYNLAFDDGAPPDDLVVAVDSISAEEPQMRVLVPGDGQEPWSCEVREAAFPGINLADELRKASE